MRKAFTLIEFLIALVIIGFIVAILVGVFSSPVKQAKEDAQVSQIIDAFQAAKNALELYATRKTTDYPIFPTSGYYDTVWNPILNEGILTAKPQIPQSATIDADPNHLVIYPGIDGWAGTAQWGDPAENDLYLWATVKPDTCTVVNSHFGIASNRATADGFDPAHQIQCLCDDPNTCYVMMGPVEAN